MAVNPTTKRGHSSQRTNPTSTDRLTKTERLGMVKEPVEDRTHPEHPYTPHQILWDRWTNTHHIPILEIHWLDAISTGDDWITEHHIDTRPAPSIALGYLTAQTEHTITITALINEEHYANGITIPKGCIIHTRTIN